MESMDFQVWDLCTIQARRNSSCLFGWRKLFGTTLDLEITKIFHPCFPRRWQNPQRHTVCVSQQDQAPHVSPLASITLCMLLWLLWCQGMSRDVKDEEFSTNETDTYWYYDICEDCDYVSFPTRWWSLQSNISKIPSWQHSRRDHVQVGAAGM